jgi:collagenase-like PrtC family protease
MLKEGAKIKIDGKMGRIIYVNRLIKCYQVMYDDGKGELIPFDHVADKKVEVVK